MKVLSILFLSISIFASLPVFAADFACWDDEVDGNLGDYEPFHGTKYYIDIHPNFDGSTIVRKSKTIVQWHLQLPDVVTSTDQRVISEESTSDRTSFHYKDGSRGEVRFCTFTVKSEFDFYNKSFYLRGEERCSPTQIGDLQWVTAHDYQVCVVKHRLKP